MNFFDFSFIKMKLVIKTFICILCLQILCFSCFNKKENVYTVKEAVNISISELQSKIPPESRVIILGVYSPYKSLQHTCAIIKDEIEAALVKFAEKGDFSVSPERIASHSEKKHSKTIIVIGKLGKGIQNTSHSKKEKKIYILGIKAINEETNNIIYSNCYEVTGIKESSVTELAHQKFEKFRKWVNERIKELKKESLSKDAIQKLFED